MKHAFSTILILLALAIFAAGQETVYGSNDVRQFRAMRDRDFRNASLSPLLSEDFANFNGLLYFAEDEKFVVKARLEKTEDKKVFTVPTSVGTSPARSSASRAAAQASGRACSFHAAFRCSNDTSAGYASRGSAR